MSATATQAPTSSTPILDKLMPMPARRGMNMVQVWIELFLGCALPILFFLPLPFMKRFLAWAARNFMLMMSDHWALLRLFATLYGIALACSLSIAIHECGHLLAGLATGFRCESFRFGRFKIEKGFKVSRYQNLEDASIGWARMVPVHSERLRWRSVVMILAGPLANLLSAYFVIKLLSDPSFISGSFIAVSIYLGIANLLPIRVPGHVNDGQRLWMLLFDRKRSERYFSMFSLTDQVQKGLPLDSLDSAALEKAVSLRDRSIETVKAQLFAYLAAISRKDYLKASEFLENALAASGDAPSPLREMLMVYAALFQAKQKRFDLAEQWLADAPGRTVLLEPRSKLEEQIAMSKQMGL
jgi:hypothetical protein